MNPRGRRKSLAQHQETILSAQQSPPQPPLEARLVTIRTAVPILATHMGTLRHRFLLASEEITRDIQIKARPVSCKKIQGLGIPQIQEGHPMSVIQDMWTPFWKSGNPLQHAHIRTLYNLPAPKIGKGSIRVSAR